MASSPLSQTAEFVRHVAAKHGRKLRRYLIGRLRAGDDAEDMAQEVYLRLLKLDRTDLIREPAAYLHVVTRQVFQEYREREAKQPLATEDDTLDQLVHQGQNPMADEMAEREHLERELQRLMNKLDDARRQAFILKHREGFTVEQIAAVLELPEWSIKRYLKQASATLQEHSTRET
jgi:RNA polymerase sigma factor (sigma-70 family)